MYFETFADFIAMGTHGPYVWSSYGLALCVVVINLLVIARQRKNVINTVRRKIRSQALQEDTNS